MPWPRFLFFNSLGAALWIGVWGGATYWAGEEFHGNYEKFKTAEPYLIGGAVLALGLIVRSGYRHWRRSKA